MLSMMAFDFKYTMHFETLTNIVGYSECNTIMFPECNTFPSTIVIWVMWAHGPEARGPALC